MLLESGQSISFLEFDTQTQYVLESSGWMLSFIVSSHLLTYNLH